MRFVLIGQVFSLSSSVGECFEPRGYHHDDKRRKPVCLASVFGGNLAAKLTRSLANYSRETDDLSITQTGTYMGRYRRNTPDYNGEISETAINLAIAERQILNELGPKACIMEEPCKIHATRKAKRGAQPEWSDILR